MIELNGSDSLFVLNSVEILSFIIVILSFI